MIWSRDDGFSGRSREEVLRLLGSPDAGQDVESFLSATYFSGPRVRFGEEEERAYLGVAPAAPWPATIDTYSLGQSQWGLGADIMALLVSYAGNRVVGAAVTNG